MRFIKEFGILVPGTKTKGKILDRTKFFVIFEVPYLSHKSSELAFTCKTPHPESL